MAVDTTATLIKAQPAVKRPRDPLLSSLGGLRLLLAMAAFLTAGLIGLRLTFVDDNISPVWPATGVGMGLMWLWGRRMAPGLFIGALLVNATTSLGALPLLTIGLGNAGESLLAVSLAHCLRVDLLRHRVRDLLIWSLVCVPAGCALSASIGLLSVCGAGTTGWDAAGSKWWTWWTGNLVGAIVVTLAIIHTPLAWQAVRQKPLEVLSLVACLLGAVVLAFYANDEKGYTLTPWIFLCFPVLVWSALRFGPGISDIAVLLTAASVTWFTIDGHGPFADHAEINNRLFELQAFLMAMALMTAILACVTAQGVQATQDLRDSEERFRIISEVSRDLICLHEPDGTYVYVSPSVTDILGYAPLELLGESPYDFFHPDDAERIRKENHLRLLLGNEIEYVQYRFRKSDGSYVWFETTAQQVIGPDGGLTGLQTNSRDITQRRLDEEQLLEARRTAIERDRMAMIGTLAGGVAHEFNNLNAVIMGNAELLLQQLDEANCRQRVHEILDAVHRSHDITCDLLDFARQDQRTLEVMDLVDVLQSSLNLARRSLHRHQVEVELDLPERKVLVEASRGGLGQVLLNLILNAAEAMIDNDDALLAIRIVVDDEAEIVHLAMRDNGAGIAPENLSRVFTPFFSTKGVYAKRNDSQANLRGTGLGLAVCQALVSQMNGSITLDSALGKGTTFTLVLPMAAGTAVHKILPGDDQTAQRLSVLVIEDEESLRSLMQQQLKNAGHAVRTAGNGREGLDLLTDETFDLTILDWQMPVLDGPGFLQAYRQRHRSMPVIVVSGWSAGITTTDDIVDVLNKPFTTAQLLEAVQQAIGPRPG